jgi:EAL domain-containing protein (putative c-di-GMP-specific phosphodiesterase class I)
MPRRCAICAAPCPPIRHSADLLIEIDSSEVIDHLDLVVDAARRLRLHNIAIAIDNVGAEWPSLLELRSFPFVELKVDQQYINGCANDRLKQTVCRRIVELARDNGARAIAQGVETRADFLAAHDMGFDLVQGYLFGKPVAVRKFARSRPQLRTRLRQAILSGTARLTRTSCRCISRCRSRGRTR